MYNHSCFRDQHSQPYFCIVSNHVLTRFSLFQQYDIHGWHILYWTIYCQLRKYISIIYTITSTDVFLTKFVYIISTECVGDIQSCNIKLYSIKL